MARRSLTLPSSGPAYGGPLKSNVRGRRTHDAQPPDNPCSRSTSAAPIFPGRSGRPSATTVDSARQRLPVPVHHDSALEAAKLLKDWCAWLATISTAAIAASGFLAPRIGSCGARNAFAVLAIVAFAASILTTATLLLALPSVIARFTRDKVSIKNDFYEAQAFVWASTSLGGLTPLFRIGFIAAIQYLCFALGVLAFSGHAALRLTDP